jgi:ABC transporter with metal-binding/Fe-S-binding domain ATP-binding protein
MRVGALFSGGKDSTYAAYLTSRENDLVCLVTLSPKTDMSYMFHYPNIRWTRLQAEAMGLPQVFKDTPGIKEEELGDLETAIRKAASTYDLDAICTGALASVYQKSRVERLCNRLGIHCISPLWGVDPQSHLRRLVDDGFVVAVVAVSAMGLTQDWLGKVLDRDAVDELIKLAKRYRFHAGLEGGEGETFVLDAPCFERRIEVRSARSHWNGDSGMFEIIDAHLVPKPRREEEA